jgi:NAD(P)-dependent dehydrogenase (short-subunit alcohol dehydrogenase family)
MNRTPRLAIVTGGASGLGLAFARHLAREGNWHVVVADYDTDRGLAAAREVGELAAREHEPSSASTVQFCELDVTDREAWNRLRDTLRPRWGALALLVNSAGICGSGEIARDDPAFWRNVLETNLWGTLWGCQTMIGWSDPTSQERSLVVNIASIMGLISAPAMGAYSVSKAAVVCLSETLHAEWRGTPRQVRIVAPGFFASQLLASGQFAHALHREQAETLTRNSKFTADDVVRAALSPRAGLYVVLGRRARWLWRWKRLAPTHFLNAVAKRYKRLMIDRPTD